MKLEDLQDAESYIYIRVLAKIANRFKEGDYITVSELDYPDEGDRMIWSKEEYCIEGFRSRIDSNKNVNVFFTPIHKITKCVDGYIETETVNPLAGTEFESRYRAGGSDITGYSLRSHIEDFICDLDTEIDPDIVIQFFADGYLKLDEDFADSIIFESPYTPYLNRNEIKEMMDKLEQAKELEQKELLRQRALRGHATRRARKELAAKQAKSDARKAAAILRAQKATKTKKKKK